MTGESMERRSTEVEREETGGQDVRAGIQGARILNNWFNIVRGEEGKKG